MARWQAVVLGAVTAVALTVGGAPPAAADEVWLRSGGMLRGDLDLGDLVVETPTGSYRVTRERVSRVVLDTGPADDSVDLRNGSRVSGLVNRGPYALRVPDGHRSQGGQAIGRDADPAAASVRVHLLYHQAGRAQRPYDP